MSLRTNVLRLAIALGALNQCVPSVSSAPSLPVEQMAVPERMFDGWGLLPPHVRNALRMLLESGPEESDRLLSSNDPREIGLGLFVLEQMGDLERLVSLVELLNDGRLTVPCAAPLNTNRFVPREQSIREYLAQIYENWLGVPVQESLGTIGLLTDEAAIHEETRKVENTRERIRGVPDPWARPRPWLVKLRRASEAGRNRYENPLLREPLIAEVKNSIAALPSDIRWAVVTKGLAQGYYDRNEARAALVALDPSARDRIMSGDAFADHQGEVGWNLDDKELVAKARDLLVSP